MIHDIKYVDNFNSVYGYIQEKQEFLQIFVYDPKIITKLRDLLWSGIILNFRIQAYEAHITYFMHFYTDYDLYGMDFLKFDNFKFRQGGLPKIKPKHLARKTLYNLNFWTNFTSRPIQTYVKYDFLQDDTDLKLFDRDSLSETVKNPKSELYLSYKKYSTSEIEVDIKWYLDFTLVLVSNSQSLSF